jgi:thymidylate synthase (FAD)
MEIKVLDKGFVRLVDVMGDDRAIVQAARVSYGEGTKSFRQDASLIDYLMRHRHTSPFEMVEFKFHIKAPIFVVRQWFRHRTASVNEISARYSVLKDEFYVPEKFRFQSKTNKQKSEGEFEDREALETYLRAINESYKSYIALLDRGVAREMARSTLPVSIYTEFYWKQDLHNLFHFLKLRLGEDAQHEIREYAKAIAQIVKDRVPLAYASFEEHVLYGKTFSKTELEVIKKYLDKEKIAQELLERGLSTSKVREFLEKLA